MHYNTILSFQIVDFLKRRWKNLRDGMMRCLKKENVSYRANSKVPTCRLYNNLIFLKEFFQGNSTDEKLLVSFNGTDENDIELPDSPHSGSSPTHNNESGSRKRSASSTAGDSTYTVSYTHLTLPTIYSV